MAKKKASATEKEVKHWPMVRVEPAAYDMLRVLAAMHRMTISAYTTDLIQKHVAAAQAKGHLPKQLPE